MAGTLRADRHDDGRASTTSSRRATASDIDVLVRSENAFTAQTSGARGARADAGDRPRRRWRPSTGVAEAVGRRARVRADRRPQDRRRDRHARAARRPGRPGTTSNGFDARSPAATPAGRGRGRDRRGVRDGRTTSRSATRSRILFEGPPGEFEVVGIAGYGESDSLFGATLGALRPARPRSECSDGGAARLVSVVAEEGVTGAPELRSRVAAVLPERLEAVTGADADERAAGAGQPGARVPAHGAPRVRVRLAVRRRLHHLQHVLDHRRAADARARRCSARSAPAGGRS